MRKSALKTAIFVSALAASTVGAQTHPHVFAEARLELKADNDGFIEELRHVWRFDELFTATVIIEFDEDKSGALEDPELDEVANTVASSIAGFGYFQSVEVDGRNIPLKRVEQMAVAIEGTQLLILFEAEPSIPVALKDAPKIAVFDPTFYTAIEFYDEQDMVMINAPVNCGHEMVVPDPDEALAQNQQSLTEAFFDPADPVDMSMIFATRMEVSCVE